MERTIKLKTSLGENEGKTSKGREREKKIYEEKKGESRSKKIKQRRKESQGKSEKRKKKNHLSRSN